MHKILIRIEILIIFIVAIFANSCFANDILYVGIGPGMQLMDRHGTFNSQYQQAQLFAAPHGFSWGGLAQLSAGYEWMMNPKFCLGINVFNEWSHTQSNESVGINSNNNNLFVNTSQTNQGGYGFLIQLGIHMDSMQEKLYFNAGLARSQFDTNFQQRFVTSGSTLVNADSNSHWSTGLRFGVSEESPLFFSNKLLSRFDWSYTRYQPWNIANSVMHFTSNERPIVTQLTWTVIWPIDMGDHEYSHKVPPGFFTLIGDIFHTNKDNKND